jgi:hypothetical protein
VKDGIRICIKVTGRIRIRIKVTSRIQVRNTADQHQFPVSIASNRLPGTRNSVRVLEEVFRLWLGGMHSAHKYFKITTISGKARHNQEKKLGTYEPHPHEADEI